MTRFLLTCYIAACLPVATWAVKGPVIPQAMIEIATTSTSSPTPTSNSNDIAFLSPVFGLSKRLPSSLSVRGGEVLEPESADDVDSILIKAGSENKLVVIDFTASW
jgi:hypothetical protein